MRENEPIKVLVNVGLWARFKCPTILPTPRHETYLAKLGEIVVSLIFLITLMLDKIKKII